MTQKDLIQAKYRLMEAIREGALETRAWTGRREFSRAVMSAMEKTERENFVEDEAKDFAYINRPLSIGHGQTISQPLIVAMMTDMLDLSPGERVLEIGTGCGYQAAVLAELGATVFSLERIEALATTAGRRLKKLGYDKVQVRHGDGFSGWEEKSPFDAIIVTCAPEQIPCALPPQLKTGGRLVIPLGPVGGPQMLYRCIKDNDDKLIEEPTLPVAFVPMVQMPN